jgi:hypothetical protein
VRARLTVYACWVVFVVGDVDALSVVALAVDSDQGVGTVNTWIFLVDYAESLQKTPETLGRQGLYRLINLLWLQKHSSLKPVYV